MIESAENGIVANSDAEDSAEVDQRRVLDCGSGVGFVSESELQKAIENRLRASGANSMVRSTLARSITVCERDGSSKFGVSRLSEYTRLLETEIADSTVHAHVVLKSPTHVSIDGCKGFAQPVLVVARSLVQETLDRVGYAVVSIKNTHHLGALWADVEAYAEQGLIALSVLYRNPISLHGRPLTDVRLSARIAMATQLSETELFVVELPAEESRDQVKISPGPGEDHPAATQNTDWSCGSSDIADVDKLRCEDLDETTLMMLVEFLAAGLSGGTYSLEDLASEAAFDASGRLSDGQLILLVDPQFNIDKIPTQITDIVHQFEASQRSTDPYEARLKARHEASRRGIPITGAVRELLL